MSRSAIVLAGVLLATGCGRGDVAPVSSSPSAAAASGSEARAQPPATATPAASAAPAQPTTGPAAPAAAAGAESPGAAQGASGDPRIDEIRKRYAEIQADRGLHKSELRMDCPGREGSAEVRLHQKNNAVSIAELKDIPPGDGGSTYYFYYDNGQLIFALNDAEPFGGATETRLLQRRFYYHQGSPILCTKKEVWGPADKVEPLLNNAPNEPVDCSFAPKVQRLASTVKSGAAGMDDLKKLLCAKPAK
ncbi:hypothetical protein [Sorangium sp. So ce1389]|uniref:hypothetical protein n=1 Tax=Sorangium sp. So ce1389 TaxID=3133336 RepID=UPI003F628E06